MGRIDEKIIGERRINHQKQEIWDGQMRKSQGKKNKSSKTRNMGRIDEKIIGERIINHQKQEIQSELMRKSQEMGKQDYRKGEIYR